MAETEAGRSSRRIAAIARARLAGVRWLLLAAVVAVFAVSLAGGDIRVATAALVLVLASFQLVRSDWAEPAMSGLLGSKLQIWGPTGHKSQFGL